MKLQKKRDTNNVWIEGTSSIASAGETFFSTLFKDELSYDNSYYQNLESVLSLIPRIITDRDNDFLQEIPSNEEIRTSVFSLDPDSAPGPDGFSGVFYQSCWNIIAKDLCAFVRAFFCGASLPKGYSATLLSLIPKIDCPQSFSDFRPISLCNFSYKIISKILASRLESLLPSLISANQSGFVKGRSLADNVLLAQELSHHIHSRNRGGNVILKLDMAKAFDRMSWIFLISVMRKFGFGEIWLDMIWRLISNCHFSLRGKFRFFSIFSRSTARGPLVSGLIYNRC